MSRRFRGESVHKVDGKGRVSIPAAFRRVLEENDPDYTSGLNPNLIIVYGNSKRTFLEGFSVASINEVDEKIAALPRGSKSCLLYTSPSPRDQRGSRMPSSA